MYVKSTTDKAAAHAILFYRYTIGLLHKLVPRGVDATLRDLLQDLQHELVMQLIHLWDQTCFELI